MWDREAVIWAAGLFEGEGSVIKDAKPMSPKSRIRWTMALSSTDLDVLKKFHRAVGGLGAIHGPYLRPISTKEIWTWRTSRRAHLYAISAALWPFMGARRQAKMTAAITEMPPVAHRVGV